MPKPKIVRRTDLQIIKDDLENLVIAPQEIDIISLKEVFFRVKNIEHFKEVMDTLMDFVIECIYYLEEKKPEPREKYQLIIKARLICETIKNKQKMRITGLSTRYKNEMNALTRKWMMNDDDTWHMFC